MTHTHTNTHFSTEPNPNLYTPPPCLSFSDCNIMLAHKAETLHEHLRPFSLLRLCVCSSIDLALCFSSFEMNRQIDGQSRAKKERIHISFSLSRHADRTKQTRADSVTGDVILQCERPPGPDPMMQHSGDTVKQVAAAGCIQNC